jgi:uncharacterized protein (DUF1697 family)
VERYIAFLRGINVSGQKIIKMDALRTVFSGAGYTGVKTYIQSGNILFDTEDQDSTQLIQRLENLVEKSFGFRTDFILRKLSDIENLVNSSLFSTLKPNDVKKYYITFLKSEFTEPLTLPILSRNKDVEIIYNNTLDFISVSTIYKGNYGFPNSFIEKLTGIPATTRNPNTLEKLLKL